MNARSTSPGRTALRLRIALKLLVTVQAVIVAILAAQLLGANDRFARMLGMEAELRGSTPPVGQVLPDLSKVPGVKPAMPAPAVLRGHAVLLVATCIECQSGSIVGRTLMGIDPGAVGGAQLHAVAWGGSADAWSREWGFDKHVFVHGVAAPSDLTVARRLRVGLSGVAFLYDAQGRWRATYHLGQLNADDIEHDLRQLDR
jgi:hypothetical protein